MLNLNEELLVKAKEAKTVEELLELAKEHNIEVTEEEAEGYFLQLNPKAGELSDEELDNVVGGACYTNDRFLIVTAGHSCKHHMYEDGMRGWGQTCFTCAWESNDSSLQMVCTYPGNRRP